VGKGLKAKMGEGGLGLQHGHSKGSAGNVESACCG
jgi:hypothetical protein